MINVDGAGTMRRFFIAFWLAFIALTVCTHADNFPSRPITPIVPFPPGGSTDVGRFYFSPPPAKRWGGSANFTSVK
jgi:hypothetical protein